MKRLSYLGLSLVAVLALAAPGLAQQAKTTDEYNAYIAFLNETNAAKKAEFAEKFLAEPTLTASDFRPIVYNGLLIAYTNSQNWAKVVETADKLGTILPNAPDKTPAFQGAATKLGTY